MKRSLGTPDVLAKLGRPGFPKGMVVMLVGGSGQERLEIEAQMSNLGYQGEALRSPGHLAPAATLRAVGKQLEDMKIGLLELSAGRRDERLVLHMDLVG